MKKSTFIFGVAGMLFAGYMSMVKFLSDTCVFDSPCPYFWGFPACYYGFAIFTIITLIIILDKWQMVSEKTADILVLAFSFLGILFSGYFTLLELPKLFNEGLGAYFFGLPTCTLGLIIYLIIFFIALTAFISNKNKNSI